MNNFKIPKIRFMNFNDKWKYKILGEISSSIEYGLNASAKDFDGIHKYLRITDIDDSSRLFLTDKLSSPDVNFTEENYENYKLQKNDLLFARTGASVGKTYLYRESDGEVYYAGFLIRARLHDSYDGNFVFQQTLTDKYKQFTEITSQRSGQPGINGKEYGNWKIGMTSYSEQSAIGSLFRTLDDLLASYKENLANYQSLKATMLSKMFPKAGQAVPEIRLDGFKGEWEINKLNKYLTVSKQKNTQLKFDKEDVLSVSGEFGIINQIQFQGRSFAGASVEMYSIVDTGNIVYTKSPLKANPYGIIKTNYGIPGIVSTLYAVYLPNENVFPGFVERYFENDLRLNSYLKPLVNKGAKNDMKVSDENALLGAVIFPQLEEQVAISDYFTNLDKFIQSYKDKITQLETLKKKLLQNLFI
ncbi:restriction endonuclease subunit S [Streptococcus thermophilus]|uniref:restriction endonuclease subunit S n=1 Tax=Streptococcus thermophilus TaxID=1308 RepID=UPI000824A957|nr:restriction endonuclease subunit S [Streptococcus thermophilus]AOD27381.1 restriction endonuclease subunit S [Streptococcus thermophilus]MCE2286808.1 restriction endonuclease subunit S [Streptococcus thermophilus]MCE2288281.1 restriction endonuclease subunit S [Streptococcus thermophilus]MCE2289891.1 restriction endonuclease subunit S [Streptococcus thermophilus]MCE2291511.1 restriction endonuclease subunit S [Streptococcus thermophilus]